MIKKVLLGALSLTLVACATPESKIADYIKKNPKVIFDTIEANPDQFMDAVNKAAKVARDSQYKKQAAEKQIQREQQLKNPLTPDLKGRQPLFGSEKASITIVEYADFQCPACKMAHDTLTKVKQKYKGQVQFHYKHMPLDFHPMAMPAAKYFEAVRLVDKTKAEKFFNYIFEQQKQLQNEDFLKKAVKNAGVDLKAVTSKLDSEEIAKTIAADMTEFRTLGFTGTPVLIVNGIALHGAQPFEEVEKVIQLTSAKN